MATNVTACRIVGKNIAGALFIIIGGELDGCIRCRDRLPAGAIIDTSGYYSISVEYIQIGGTKPSPTPSCLLVVTL